MADQVLYSGVALHHRPDGHAGPDQSRLRRRPLRDARHGQGDDGHRRGRRRQARDRGGAEGDLQPAARRRLDEGRPRPAHLDHRRHGHDAVRVDEAATRIREEVDPDANIIFGATFDESLEGKMRVSVVATGIDAAQAVQRPPQATTVVKLAQRPTIRPVTATAPAMAAPAASMSIPAAPQTGSVAMKMEPALAPVAPAPAPVVAEAAPAPALAEPAPAELPAAPAEAFIPPKPVEVAPAAAQAPAPANPFAEAELMNATKPAAAAAPKRRPSLFERMTRSGMGRTEGEAPRAQPTLVAPQGGIMPTAPAAPVAAPAAPAPAPVAAAPVAPAAAPAQPRLGGLDPTDRLAPKAEDDLLEIPAFLRRQAN
jgi:cell division protein FtsZ